MRHSFFKRIFDLKRNQRSQRISLKRHKLILPCSTNIVSSPQLSITNPPPPAPSLEDLRKAVERSTSANRTYFISFLVILVYMLIIVASTTDFQLLIPNSLVRLPFVDTNVSLFVFYIISPLIILAAHFNLLQNLESHHNKLCKWRASYSGLSVPRVLIEAFLYDYAVLDEEGQFTKAVRFFSRMLFLFMSPAALLAFLWRFSDYQSMSITSWHFLILIIDILIVGYFMRVVTGRWLITIIGWFLVLLTILQIVIMIIVTYTDSALVWQAEKTINDWPKKNYDFIQLLDDESYRKEEITLMGAFMNMMLPRITIDPYVSLTLDDKPLKSKMALDGEDDLSKWFMEKGKGLDLRGRSLKGAWLVEADLRRAQFKNTQLQWALLTSANLQGANMQYSNLHNADMVNAQMQGINFDSANMQEASMRGAKLQGADLSFARLQGADMSESKMQGADLAFAKLQGAILREAYLQGARMFGTEMQGADLAFAHLQGAQMENVKMQGAFMNGALLQGANLGGVLNSDKGTGAEMKGVIFYGELVPIQPSSPDFVSNTDWDILRNLSASNIYKTRMTRAETLSKEIDKPKIPWFVNDDNALIDALPIICKSDYEALKGSLSGQFEDSNESAWKKILSVVECIPHLTRIAEWAKQNKPEMYKYVAK